MIRHILLAGALVAAPAAHYQGVVMSKSYEGPHPEWSWSDVQMVNRPARWGLNVDHGGLFADWICVDQATYERTPLFSYFSGQGAPR